MDEKEQNQNFPAQPQVGAPETPAVPAEGPTQDPPLSMAGQPQEMSGQGAFPQDGYPLYQQGRQPAAGGNPSVQPPVPGGPGQGAPVYPQGGSPAPGMAPAAGAPVKPPPAKKNKGPLLIGIIAAVAVVVVLLVLVIKVLPARKGASAAPEYYLNNNACYTSTDDRIYLTNQDGEYKDLGIYAQEVMVSDDGQTVVYRDDENVLRRHNVADGKEETLAEGVTGLHYLFCNEYVLYQQGEVDVTIEQILQEIADEIDFPVEFVEVDFEFYYDGEGDLEDAMELYWFWTDEEYPVNDAVMMHSLATGEQEELFSSEEASGEYEFKAAGSQNNRQMAYLDSSGTIHLIKADGERKALGRVPSDSFVFINGVPDEGEMVVWSGGEFEENRFTLSVWSGGKEVELVSERDNVNSSYLTTIQYNQKEDQVLVGCFASSDIYLVDDSGGVEEIDAGKSVENILFNTHSWENPADFDEFYVVTVSGSSRYGLSFVNKERELAKITGNLRDSFAVAALGDTVYYIDDNDDLYRTTFSKGAVQQELCVDEDVGYFKCSPDQKILWYLKGDSRSADLYRFENDASEKIGECEEFYVSPDGSMVLLCDEFGLGDLYVYKDGRLEWLCDDVYTDSIDLFYRGGYIDPGAVFFIGDCDEEEETGALYFYDGTELERLAEEVRPSNYYYWDWRTGWAV